MVLKLVIFLDITGLSKVGVVGRYDSFFDVSCTGSVYWIHPGAC